MMIPKIHMALVNKIKNHWRPLTAIDGHLTAIGGTPTNGQFFSIGGHWNCWCLIVIDRVSKIKGCEHQGLVLLQNLKVR